jgi:glycosidase
MQFAVLQFTYVGAPMIYYGDEIGMWGANDPDCRKPMIWDDIAFEDEVTFPDQTTHEPDSVKPNMELHAFYKKLIALRNSEKALRMGDYRTEIADNGTRIFGFARTFGEDEILVVLNASDRDQNVIIGSEAQSYKNLLTGELVPVYRQALMPRVEARGWLILKRMRG